MPRIGDMKTSKFLKSSDLGDDGERLLTITGVSEENVGTEQKEDIKWALLFKEIDKPMVLNWTNMQLCAAAFGSEQTDDWIGKKIIVWFDPSVMYMGEMKGGLRVRKAPAGTNPARTGARVPEVPPPPDDDDDIPF